MLWWMTWICHWTPRASDLDSLDQHIPKPIRDAKQARALVPGFHSQPSRIAAHFVRTPGTVGTKPRHSDADASHWHSLVIGLRTIIRPCLAAAGEAAEGADTAKGGNLSCYGFRAVPHSSCSRGPDRNRSFITFSSEASNRFQLFCQAPCRVLTVAISHGRRTTGKHRAHFAGGAG